MFELDRFEKYLKTAERVQSRIRTAASIGFGVQLMPNQFGRVNA